MRYHDRVEAGQRLAGNLMGCAARTDVLVLGLPRGGVPVAAEVARATLDRVAAGERTALEDRARLYRGARSQPDVAGRTVILVDDGLATGATMEAAVAALRTQSPARIVVAAPVGSREACACLARRADTVVCPLQPEPFDAVGLWYDDFRRTTDADVRAYLGDAPRS